MFVNGLAYVSGFRPLSSTLLRSPQNEWTWRTLLTKWCEREHAVDAIDNIVARLALRRRERKAKR